MRFRKALLAGAAVVAAGLLGLTSTANAGVSSGTLQYVRVDGNTSGSHAINGTFTSGTATFAGAEFGCSGGSVGGNATAGAVPPGGHIAFDSLNIVCDTPLGTQATITVDTGCATFDPDTGQLVNDGKTDAAVTGTVALTTGCGNLVASPCTADVQGSVDATYNEVAQQLILDGPGFSVSGASGLCSIMNGPAILNDITFSINAAAGGLDFRVTP